jgi:serine/threonine protein kinase/ABC-type phosphate/phosphonate transport system substrate-binding protein
MPERKETKMAKTKSCPRCGEVIPAHAPDGHCPRCLIANVLAVPPETGPQVGKGPGKAGLRLGDYEVVRLIGRGGMGVVYEAVQLSLRRPVALKMIVDSQLASPDARRRFALEAEAAARLDHPNIVPIYEVGEHEDQPFLAMRLVQGESLRRKMACGELGATGGNQDRSKTLTRERETAGARLMAIVARAVHYAHQRGVLHRDLKPANILMDGEGMPHLTDFGLAKLLDQARAEGSQGLVSQSDSVGGTPSHMAPEQALGQRASTATDVYGLGATLYELLTDQPPFHAATPLETMRLVVEQPPTRPRSINPRIDRDLETICLKCLEKNPPARYGSALAVAEELERWLRLEPILARPAGPILRLGRWSRRNPIGTALIVSLLFGLAVSLAFLHKALQSKRDKEIYKQGIVAGIADEVGRLWRDSNKAYVRISSASCTALADRPLRPAPPEALRLSFALTIEQEPAEHARTCAPFLERLEDKMTRALGRPVLLDLMAYKAGGSAHETVAKGETDVRCLSALAYLQARRDSPGLQPVAHVETGEEAVLFVRHGLGRSNLYQLVGARFVVGPSNSIVTCLAKHYLAQAGLREMNLASVVSLERDRSFAGQMAGEETDRLGDDEGPYTQRPVVRAVLSGKFDAGVVRQRLFERHRYTKPGLVAIRPFPVSPEVYAVRSGLEAEVVQALQKSLCSFKTPEEMELLRYVYRDPVQRLSPARDSDFDDLRNMLTNTVAQFHLAPGVSPGDGLR